MENAMASKADTKRSDGSSTPAAPDWLPAPPHTIEAEQCLKTFKVSARKGLSESQVAEYKSTFGPNKLKGTLSLLDEAAGANP
jgi:hypothetical protein